MSNHAYTMFEKRGDHERVVASGVTIANVLIIALEHRRRATAALTYRNHGDLRVFILGRCASNGGTFEVVLPMPVTRTRSLVADRARAMKIFEKIMARHPSVFWGGRLVRTGTGRTRRRPKGQRMIGKRTAKHHGGKRPFVSSHEIKKLPCNAV